MLKWVLVITLAISVSCVVLITAGNGDEAPPASNIMLTSDENNNIKITPPFLGPSLVGGRGFLCDAPQIPKSKVGESRTS